LYSDSDFEKLRFEVTMASLWKDDRSPYFTACVALYEGRAHRQLKKSTGTADRKLARRIADELEETGHGRRTAEEVSSFLGSIKDLRCAIASRKAFNDVLLKATGHGLTTKTVRGYGAEWLERVNGEVSASTWTKYQKTVEQFADFLGSRADVEMAMIRRDDISRFRDEQGKRVARSTANLALKIVRLFFASAERDGIVAKNEAKAVQILKAPNGDEGRRAFTVEEVKRVLEVCDPEWRSMVVFGLYTGARLGDIATLTWRNLDLQSAELRFVTGKTGRTMILPLAGPLKAHVERLPAGDDPKAFLHPRAAGVVERQGGRVGSLSNQFYEILADAGLVAHRSHRAAEKGGGRAGKRQGSTITFHSLRHSFVSWLKATGVAQSVAMDLAGHQSVEVSRNYTHTTDELKAAALGRLPDLVG
jgi:integrase